MNITMKKKPRAPRAGDLWRHNTSFEVVQVLSIRADDLVMVLHGEAVVHVMPDVLTRDFSWRAQHAVTLAEREDLGIMPTITEDDRTPLERMTAERDAAVADRDSWRAVANQMETQRDAAVAEVRVWADEVQRMEALMEVCWHKLTFAQVFAASHGRVVAGLKEDCAELVTERDGTDAGIDAAIAYAAKRIEDEAVGGRNLFTSARRETLRDVADELGALSALHQPKEPSADDALLQVRSALRGGV
jgi:hypothetical protein